MPTRSSSHLLNRLTGNHQPPQSPKSRNGPTKDADADARRILQREKQLTDALESVVCVEEQLALEKACVHRAKQTHTSTRPIQPKRTPSPGDPSRRNPVQPRQASSARLSRSTNNTAVTNKRTLVKSQGYPARLASSSTAPAIRPKIMKVPVQSESNVAEPVPKRSLSDLWDFPLSPEDAVIHDNRMKRATALIIDLVENQHLTDKDINEKWFGKIKDNAKLLDLPVEEEYFKALVKRETILFKLNGKCSEIKLDLTKSQKSTVRSTSDEDNDASPGRARPSGVKHKNLLSDSQRSLTWKEPSLTGDATDLNEQIKLMREKIQLANNEMSEKTLAKNELEKAMLVNPENKWTAEWKELKKAMTLNQEDWKVYSQKLLRYQDNVLTNAKPVAGKRSRSNRKLLVDVIGELYRMMIKSNLEPEYRKKWKNTMYLFSGTNTIKNIMSELKDMDIDEHDLMDLMDLVWKGEDIKRINMVWI